ncbi:MAG: protein kinase [Gemmatimonadales bacterium]
MDSASDELAQLQRALASVYKVERLLVRRGTTVVYQATEVNPPRPVALRVFPAELDLAPVSERFRELARLLVALNHPSILPVYRIVFRGGVPYLLATKLAEGRHLDEVLASQGPLHLPLVLTVLRATAAAIAYAHEHGTLHGALTTAHILLDRDGHVLVENFGVARAMEDAGSAADGAPRVAIPEEAAGAAAGPAGDQYAFGIVALEMLSGSGQFGADPLASLREVRTARVALPDALLKILQTVLANDPTQRFASAGDLHAALQAIAFGDAELREATVGLGRLARGEPVPKLRAAAPTGVTPARPMPAPPAPAAPPAVLDLETTAPAPVHAAAPAPPPPPPPPPPLPPAAAVEPPPQAQEPAPTQPVRERIPSSPALRAPVEPAPAAPIMRASRARESAHFAAPPPPKRRSRVVSALGALLVIAVVAGAAYWLGRRSALGPAAQAPGAGSPVAPAAPRVAVAESARAGAAHPAPTAADSANAAAAAAPKTGRLTMDASGPRGVFIFIDNKQVGRRGRLDSAVTAGRHHIEVVAAGYQGWDTVIVVPAGGSLDLGDVPLDSVATEQPAPAPKDTGGP